MPERVLIAGSSGFVGGAAVEHFAAAGWEVVGLARRTPAVPIAGARYVETDLLDPSACRTAPADTALEAVFSGR